MRAHRPALLAVASALLGSVFVLWLLVRHGPLPGETDLTASIRSALLRPDRIQVVDFVALMSAPGVAVVTVVAGALIAWRRVGLRAALLVVAASAIIVITDLAKRAVGPTGAFIQATGQVTDNFPSGHVSYVTAVFGAFGWLGWTRSVPEVAVVAVMLTALMGPARVAHVAHVPSDALAGYLLGSGWLIVCVVAISSLRFRKTRRT